MTVVMAVPAMTMMMVMVVSDRDNNLGARCRNQRNEEHQSEKAKTKFLHSQMDALPHVRVVDSFEKFISPTIVNPRNN